MRLLLVEDDRALGQGIRVALSAEGYTLDWLQDGASALHALRTESFDLLLLDLGLPRLDGLELLQQLRAAQQDLPVLILTARDGTAERIAGLDAGADDYLVKPFDVENSRPGSAPCCAAARVVPSRCWNTPASASTRPTSKCSTKTTKWC